jgi:exosortase F-associated protein
MLRKLLQNKKRLFLIVFALLGLILVRAFENELFYDPFLTFFKSDYQNKSLPDYDSFLLFGNLLLRYFLNTFLSLIIIRFLFNDKKLMIFSSYLFLLFFIVLILVFFGLLHFSEKLDYLMLFYIRRFLIQPLFLVLFIPAFYYQQITK